MPKATGTAIPLLVSTVAAVALLGSLSPPPAHARDRVDKRQQARVQALGDAYRAFEAQDYRRALKLASSIDSKRLENTDYAVFVRAQSAYLLRDYRKALEGFRYLARASGSRFRLMAAWRVADCHWRLDHKKSARSVYRELVAKYADQKKSPGDLGLARFRIAEADAHDEKRKRAIAGMRAVLLLHPDHPLAERALQRLRELGGDKAARLSALDRIERAQVLTAKHRWRESVAELEHIGDDHGERTLRERDYWTATTYFKMRRRYKDASDIFLRIYKRMGSRAARALFHGARALSRADFDKEAIGWYLRVVAEYPSSPYAKEAQFLAGWLQFNLGDYRAAIPHLQEMLKRFGRSRWATDGRWFLGFSLFRLARYEEALPHFEALAKKKGRLVGGKGRYWLARTQEKLARADSARQGYLDLVARYPFSWYAHLARARLAARGVAVSPFGDLESDPAAANAKRTARAKRVPGIDRTIDESLADDPLIRRADELLAAGLTVEAGVELRRGEKSFLKRVKKRSSGLAMLMDRYRKADNFNRPWMLAVVYGSRRALNAEPKGQARVWWEHGYPQAYSGLIERWASLGQNPDYYLYAIMRKESGYNPHVLSYANAIGLLQMIPATTKRVVKHLGVEYTDDLLYDPELNIKSASWYIGRLLQKFRGQIPLGSGSFNCGPRPVMRWLDKFGELPMDEFVETVPYRATREYMKKVTETYSRYVYLYAGTVYDQPLVVARDYLKNELTY